MTIDNARILIIGLGISGEAAAALCASRSATVTVTDTRDSHHLRQSMERLTGAWISYRLGSEPVNCENFTLIVRSPGVPRDLPILHEARLRGIPVWSEIELAHALCPCPIVAITGTNGKSTTTTLVGAMMAAASRTTHVVGNIGVPFTAKVGDMSAGDVAVVEVSSAQLEDCHDFRPATAVLTNIRPEHMDHYTLGQYGAAKARIVRNHTVAQSTVVNYDDKQCCEVAKRTPGRIMYFSAHQRLPLSRDGVFVEGDEVVAQCGGVRTLLCGRQELKVPGTLPNILAMMAVGMLWRVPAEVMRRVALDYTGREHVIEYTATVEGVEYYNDSKATNPWSTVHALESFPERPVVLIAGGKDDKEADVDPLAAVLAGRVRHLVTIGQTGRRIAAAARTHNIDTITTAESLTDAVYTAAEVAHPGDVVLFSPGANSKDMFPDHRTRGTMFKQQVHLLAARQKVAS